MSFNAVSVRIKDRTDYKVKEVNTGVDELKELADVSVLSANNGDTLVYNSNTHIFESKTITLTDVTTTVQANAGDALIYDANTQSFIAQPITNITTNLDAGSF